MSFQSKVKTTIRGIHLGLKIVLGIMLGSMLGFLLYAIVTQMTKNDVVTALIALVIVVGIIVIVGIWSSLVEWARSGKTN